jgi:hypothetical protein
MVIGDIISLLTMRYESHVQAMKHHANNGDYDRAADSKTRAGEVFNILQDLNKFREIST